MLLASLSLSVSGNRASQREIFYRIKMICSFRDTFSRTVGPEVGSVEDQGACLWVPGARGRGEAMGWKGGGRGGGHNGFGDSIRVAFWKGGNREGGNIFLGGPGIRSSKAVAFIVGPCKATTTTTTTTFFPLLTSRHEKDTTACFYQLAFSTQITHYLLTIRGVTSRYVMLVLLCLLILYHDSNI
ncbi:hypothetical protein GGR50DRAFT_453877 [Xylaria sp. CBS 124048]|nr:hypothetical protein GGR50DRAFT_453877 [Xylaria sp. CBS 124048]